MGSPFLFHPKKYMLFEKVVAFTFIYDIHTGFHGGTALLPLNLAASFHFDRAINNFGIQEYMLHQAFRHEVFTPNFRLERGFLLMNDTPASAKRSTKKMPSKLLIKQHVCRRIISATAPCSIGEPHARPAACFSPQNRYIFLQHQPLQRVVQIFLPHDQPKGTRYGKVGNGSFLWRFGGRFGIGVGGDETAQRYALSREASSRRFCGRRVYLCVEHWL